MNPERQRPLSAAEEAEIDRLDARGDLNPFQIRNQVLSESTDTRHERVRSPQQLGRIGHSAAREVQPRDSDIDPHWQRTVDYLSPEQAARNNARIAEIRARLKK